MFTNLKREWINVLQNKYIDLLVEEVHLPMIELGKGKSAGFVHTKTFQKALQEQVERLYPSFTVREWAYILELDAKTIKRSGNAKEKIQKEIFSFLTLHYMEVYHSFNMREYELYQQKKMEDIFSITYVTKVGIEGSISEAVVICYQDGARMAYQPKTGRRVIIENMEFHHDSTFITLVEKRRRKESFFLKRLQNFFSI